MVGIQIPTVCKAQYSGDLNTELVWYWNGHKLLDAKWSGI